MPRIAMLLAAFLLAVPAAAADVPEWRWASEQDVLLTSFEYEPEMLRLPAGEPVKLRFYNGGRSTLTVQARDFFERARIRAADAETVAGGRVRLAPGEAVTVSLVPAPGRYRMRSSNLIHRLLGMTGEIVVE